MCGIAGFWQQGGAGDNAKRVIAAMTHSLRHRGPDDHGVWLDTQVGIALGHRRLSILDVSPDGNQPMRSASGRYWVTYNGEIYNFRDLRYELEDCGHAFHTQCDTEVLLAAVTEWGVEGALERINGMFAFGLWDTVEQRLYLARDRFGEKPLYYGWLGDTFVFASEVKALTAHPAFEGSVNSDAVRAYFAYGMVPGDQCIYTNISKLSPASWTCIATGDVGCMPHIRKYWSMSAVIERAVSRPFAGDVREAVFNLDSLMQQSVRLRLQADVPVGLFLSGGIDSSLIAAVAQQQRAERLQTFTIGFDEDGFDESVFAAEVARELGTDHHEMRFTPGLACQALPTITEMNDEPFADSSQIPTLLVSQLARRTVTVCLSGDGGDEIFGGYNRYLRLRTLSRAVHAVPRRLRAMLAQTAQQLADRTDQDGNRSLLRRGAALLQAQTACELYEDWIWVSSTPKQRVGLSSSIEALALPSANLIHQMMYLDTAFYLPDDLLVKTDRATMADSLECRLPFLDLQIFEFAWRLPLNFKVRGKITKYVTRELLRRYLPQAVDRPKKGFTVPIGRWMRGPMRAWAEDLLSETELRRTPYLNPADIRQYWKEHLAEHANHREPLWRVLMFQCWDRARRDRQPSARVLGQTV